VLPSGEVAATLRFSLKALSELCGLGERADNARRALESMHEDLSRAGYLREVTLEGRGMDTELTYTVQDALDA